MPNIDSSYRIGRCSSCEWRPAFAWPAYTGLRLEDVRCPRCGSLLDQTSRQVHSIRTLTPAEEEASRERALSSAEEQLRFNREALDLLADRSPDPATEAARSISMPSFARSIERAEQRMNRLRNGRELAAKKRREES